MTGVACGSVPFGTSTGRVEWVSDSVLRWVSGTCLARIRSVVPPGTGCEMWVPSGLKK